MPEGDTVSKLAAVLARDLCGQTASALRTQRLPVERLIGHRILRVSSKGKHLFIDFENGYTLRSHLGMYGSWHRYRPREPWRKPAWQASIVIETQAGVLVCFNAREVEIMDGSGYRLADMRRRLGPDLTREQPDSAVLECRARELLEPNVPLVDLLLDQRVASGIGNVYKSEVLFLARQPPLKRLGDTPLDVLALLYAQAGDLLRRNLKGGPRVTRFVRDGSGELWVYGRADRPCLRCGGPIRREHLGVRPRSTYFCPQCQGVS